MLKTNSLSFRLIAGAAVWSILGLVIGGLILSGIFRSSVEDAFDDRLTFDLEGLVAAAETDSAGSVTLEDRYADPRFERIFSGWYWEIAAAPENTGANPSNDDGAPPLTSRSLWDHTLMPTGLITREGMQWGYAVGPDQQRLRILQRRIELPVQTGEGPQISRPFLFTLAADLSETESDIASFNRTLFWSFAALALGLISAVILQVRVGLMPLRRVSEALARIREGRARQLEGKFPAEIEPLANELNGLIAHSAEVVGRARTHVSNLAHFLKTPLTVLANEAAANGGAFAETVSRQVTVMRRQVDHYLARARAAGALDVLGSRTEIAPVLKDLTRVLTRIHAEKNVHITLDAPEGLAFRGEREDLEEMAGNLIDNACKWTRSTVAISLAPHGEKQFLLRVGDDGHGLTPEERERAMQRGERLDESVPGSGLGLAIVRDIAKLYGGNFTLDQSLLGGLEAKLELPLAR